ncbi:hypothetical protein RCC89_13740 [Cytophagaceae bacterium ABcell3]|nr:hypothetical protein RCC89_13740 [Cytophagaceae bacterium ABcell3]
MQIEAVRTTNHAEIKRWVKDRHGVPARILETDTPGLGPLTIYFPEAQEKPDNLEVLTWDVFLEDFENHGYRFVYQEALPDGTMSYFYRIERG